MEDGTIVYSHEGKKEIAVRTLSIEKTKARMEEMFSNKPTLNKYYNWKLYVEDSKTEDESVVSLPRCEADDIVTSLYEEHGCNKVLIETGPSTVHK